MGKIKESKSAKGRRKKENKGEEINKNAMKQSWSILAPLEII